MVFSIFLFKIEMYEKVKNFSFMNEEFNSNEINFDQLNSNSEETDYKNLISRLQEIKKTISLLEKKYLKKS